LALPTAELIDTIIQGLKKEGGFTLPSFGTFTVKKTKARKAAHPRTGEPVKVKAGRVIQFRASPNLQNAVIASDDRMAQHGRPADHPPPPVTPANTESPGVPPSAFTPGPRARALLNGVKIAEQDLRSAGGAYDLAQVQLLMHGISRQRIEQLVRDKALLAVPGPSNRRRYPAFQFNPDGTIIDGLQKLQETLNFSSPWSLLNFLVNPDDHLSHERPIDVLRRGDISLVLESARRIGIQGA
jgi:nucleoid DNA-binding protein